MALVYFRDLAWYYSAGKGVKSLHEIPKWVLERLNFLPYITLISIEI